MLKQSRTISTRGPWSWSRVRVQLGGALLLGAALPTIILLALRPDLVGQSIIDQTSFGIAAAICLGVYLLRNITLFPGIRTGYFILPSVLIAYGIIFSLFLFLRLDYIRLVLFGSFAATLAWLYLANYFSNRTDGLTIGVVPHGDVGSLVEVDDIDWVWLSEPVLAPGLQALVADFRADLPDEWEAFLADCAVGGLAVFHTKQLRESLTGRVEIEHLSENSFGSLVPFMAYLRLRRLIDFAAAIFALALLMPVLIIVALLIKFDSPGPALFRQQRVGYRGRPFEVVKFRTMVHGRSEEDARSGAMTRDNDERITRLGRFLRRSRIDELPQIINVLRGEMSWIGPRPEAEVLSRWYETELPFYRYRHIVPPGMTGWAQVNQGHVAAIEEVNYKLHYDFYYIKNFSPWLDALIVVRTIQTVLTGFGSR